MSKRKVSYFYDPEVGNYHYGSGHPMKPHRIQITNSLVFDYDLHKAMAVYTPAKSTDFELMRYHSREYVEFLSKITPDNRDKYIKEMRAFNVGEDSPVFSNMYDFIRSYTGASVQAAHHLNIGEADITVNWSGGLHHAKKSEASGFCYVNDIVIAILELLKYHPRVMYLDIDVHHGDGVQEAFYLTDRVMTVSFHKFGNFFPGTGDLFDLGIGNGKYYSVNVPLKDGITNETYHQIFKPVMQAVIDFYRPTVLVMQCGADSLGSDRLGCFNLSIDGHGEAVRFLKAFNIPIMYLGGGGYTVRNVARCWTYETSIVCDRELDLTSEIPTHNDYFNFFAPDYQLCSDSVVSSRMDNHNKQEYLNLVHTSVLQNLKMLTFAPSVQIQQVPPDITLFYSDNENDKSDTDTSSRKPSTSSEKCSILKPLDREQDDLHCMSVPTKNADEHRREDADPDNRTDLPAEKRQTVSEFF